MSIAASSRKMDKFVKRSAPAASAAPPASAAPLPGSGVPVALLKQRVGKERVALKTLKRLATAAGMREKGDDGHRKRPGMEEIEEELMRFVHRAKVAFDADANRPPDDTPKAR